MARNAQLVEHAETRLPFVLARLREPAEQRQHLGHLVQPGVDARQRVGFVVDDDGELEPIQRRRRGGLRGHCGPGRPNIFVIA